MHEGIWEGRYADKYGVLLLGESHYKNDPQKTFTTEEVVRYYLENEQDTGETFFNHITETFGYSPDNREMLWEKVYFGNYIDEILLNDGKKLETIAQGNIRENRKAYNEGLFKFISDKNVKVVFCFSRLVWDNLPTGNGPEVERLEKMNGSWIEKCVYLKSMEYEGIRLDEDLTVYGLRHPSRFYTSSIANKVLKGDVAKEEPELFFPNEN